MTTNTALAGVLRTLDAAQLREVISEVLRNVQDANDVAMKYVEQQHTHKAPKTPMLGLKGRSASLSSQLDISSAVSNRATDVKGKINGHTFQSHNYFVPTFCSHCRKLLKGIIRQGQQCSRCLLNAHSRCVPYLDECEGRIVSKASRRRRQKMGIGAAGGPRDRVVSVVSAAPSDVREACATPPPEGEGDDDNDDSSPESDDDENAEMGRFRAKAAVDWKAHSKSFRTRIQNSRPLDVAALHQVLQYPESLVSEFRGIPENKVPVNAIPRFTEYKNRFMNVLPNAHSRVVLPQIGDDTTSTYINANWMRGYRGRPNTFIASQGPLKDTVEDFWRMVWLCRARVIVMSTSLEEAGVAKCERYWPEHPGAEHAKRFGDIVVRVVEERKPRPQYSLTTLSVECNGEERTIEHFWWQDWPDKGVPTTTDGICDFVLASRAAAQRLGGPTVVHCSAGVGRTGCLLAVDIGMLQFDTDGVVDIVATVCQLRQDRGCTVQTDSQFQFIHQVLHDYIMAKTAPLRRKETVRDPSQVNSLLRRSMLLADAENPDAVTEMDDEARTESPAPPAPLAPPSPTAQLSPATTSSAPATASTLFSPSDSVFGDLSHSIGHEQPAPYLVVDKVSEPSEPPAANVVSAAPAPTAPEERKPAEDSFDPVPRSTPAKHDGLPAAKTPMPPPSSKGSKGSRALMRITSDACEPPSLPPDVMDDIAHDFRTRTFVKDTHCCVCNELMAGYCNQGLFCKPCSRGVHAHCLPQLTASCTLARKASIRTQFVWPPRRSSQYNKSPAAK